MSKRFDKWISKELAKIEKRYIKSQKNSEDYYLSLCVSADGVMRFRMANNRYYNEDKSNPVNIFENEEIL